MKKLFFLLLICGSATTIFSAESSTNFTAQENRFLFVIENSSAMSRSAKAAQQTVRELIESGVQGEMREGDTFGIWTFDEQLNTTLPVQRWSPTESAVLAQSAGDFLKQHQYKNKGPLSTALPRVYSLIKSSRSITVILISTGSEAIRGTPFDKEINTIYPQYSRELRDAKIPFVTVLIGWNGRPVAYSVNSSLGPIQIPQPPIKPQTKTNAVVAATNTAPVRATNEVASPETETKQDVVPDATAIAKVKIQPEIKINEVAAVISTNISTPIITPKVANESSVTTVVAVANPATPQTEPTKSTEVKAATATEISNATPSTISITRPAEEPSAVVRSTEQPSLIREREPEPAAPEQKEMKLPTVTRTPVVASQPLFAPGKLLLAGAALVLVAVVLIFLLARHSRKSQPSLISHSIDRKK